MTEKEMALLDEMVRRGEMVYWIPDQQTARRVTIITKMANEPSLCSNLADGNFVSLYNAPMCEFYVVHPIVEVIGK